MLCMEIVQTLRSGQSSYESLHFELFILILKTRKVIYILPDY
jgi:hypothetical protein